MYAIICGRAIFFGGSRSAGAGTSNRDKESNTSESSDVRGNAFYDIAIQRAKAEERINRWREERTLQGRGQQDGSTMGDELDGDGVAGGRRRNTQEGGRGGEVHQGRGGE